MVAYLPAPVRSKLDPMTKGPTNQMGLSDDLSSRNH